MIFLYLCTFPFNHIPITTSIVVEYIYSFWNASHSVEPLSHILKNSLIHLKKKCEYGPIYHLLLSIKGNSFYYVPGNCKDCLTDVQTHIQ